MLVAIMRLSPNPVLAMKALTTGRVDLAFSMLDEPASGS